jgi:hypothetical protein
MGDSDSVLVIENVMIGFDGRQDVGGALVATAVEVHTHVQSYSVRDSLMERNY